MHRGRQRLRRSKGDLMASFRTIAAVTAVTSAVPQSGQAFSRCPKSADQFADVMRQLVTSAARARVLADENPLLEPDAAFYAAELAATKTCAPTVATLASTKR